MEKKEECGVAAIFSKKGKQITHHIYHMLIALQHRGQDAAGIAIWNGKNLVIKKGLGLVTEVFTENDLNSWALANGTMGIGHTRYPTTGRCLPVDVQPIIHQNIAVAHNGHIANYHEVRKELERSGYEFKSTVDSEPIAFLLHEKEGEGERKAVKNAMDVLDGSYSVVSIFKGKLLVFRDPHALRPLVWGENEDFVCFASESAALDIIGVPHCGTVDGGTMRVVDVDGTKEATIKKSETKNCMFEYVYFARPDSIINEKYVYEIRKRLGQILAKEHPVKADVVVPVPDTSRTAAEEFSKETGIPIEEGLIKNRYIGRTFIMPTQDKRAYAVRVKLNTIKKILENKRVVLVDDSIVRGTTLREIVRMVREAGAKEVHLRITCPPLKAPCFYGVDMSTYEELIAGHKTVDEVKTFMGADSLGYVSIDGLTKAIGLPICTGCLNEDYPTETAKRLAKERKGSKTKSGERDGCG
ncbi:MAG: amidophosphoribosyltransferase [Candidatus Micrarchaeota archaeon]